MEKETQSINEKSLLELGTCRQKENVSDLRSRSKLNCSHRHRRRLKGHPLQVRHKQVWDRGFILLLTRLLYSPDQMLAVMVLSQHRVLSFKTVRPCTPCGVRCMGHAIRTSSNNFSMAPLSQFGEAARPYLRMDDWNPPTPVCKRLRLTQAVRGKLIPTGLGTSPAYENTEPGFILAVLRVPFMVCPFRSADAKSGKVV